MGPNVAPQELRSLRASLAAERRRREDAEAPAALPGRAKGLGFGGVR